MYAKHKIYAKIFNILRKFPQKNNKITLLTNKNHSFEANLEYIAKELDNRNDSGKNYEYMFIPKDSLSFANIRDFASSKYVFLVDNFFPLAFMNVEGMKWVQLWHGTGLFKKFGYDLLNDEDKKIMEMFAPKIDLVSVSSENVADIYARNFYVDKSKVKPFGVPRNDFYDEEHLSDDYLSNLRESFEKDYPQLKGKKLVLYAPTFREDPKNNAVFDYFDVEKFLNELGDEYALAIRLHPNYKRFCDEEHNIDLEDLTNRYDIINFTGFKDEQKLLILADILVADYSSIMVDYTILKKPAILFDYDLEDYLYKERGFYFDYEEMVPGKIVYNIDELIEAIKEEDFRLEKMEEFLKLQFGEFKPNSSKLILDYILDD
ncbi:MAG: CDP-glycerol glycerophosphotransferase family protein [Methanobrevibacter ruminantium]|uniref:CDP-glycerol glycerophosphotransferase family protein n=1 Tax=Methanobrevibacter ruminantium TaxID=83816 RepID=UPI0026F18734|nr:CDP-glycerol glycerophosphotransferase family protein [Methanobrevibacter ruminantium]MDO5842401.1 CDP-glycerol glycerophosphotransferase family protein [Methanobrevibacter ruminantium]